MKPLALTEKHKSKLLEMCKTLFPEYKEIKFTFNTDEYFTDNWSDTPNFGNILSFSDDTIKTGRCILINIHWFEFCLLHLSEKIYKTFFKLGEKDNWYGSHLNWAINTMYTKKPHKIHLIDYLYEEFKKLK
jgi:hypothetical protein